MFCKKQNVIFLQAKVKCCAERNVKVAFLPLVEKQKDKKYEKEDIY